MSEQEQFLTVIDRDEAERRFHAVLDLSPLGSEEIDLFAALGRVLAEDVTANVDVPSFDRSNVDGYAVRAADTFGAQEERPRLLDLERESIATGFAPIASLAAGRAIAIATGGMLPREADAVVMVEHAEIIDGRLHVRRAVSPGAAVTFAGTDVARGETVLRRGQLLSSRETGVLAAIGCARIAVWRKPRVAILSTGDELIPPGETMRPSLVFDSNARILADSVTELGGEPLCLGIVPDDLVALRQAVERGLQAADMVLLSGGTSKGAGDVSYRVVGELRDPGIVAHGVALKPGKPICLAATQGKPVVVLPGFPTSAIFTFHELVAPVLTRWSGRTAEESAMREARLAVRVNSEIGRTEFVLVGLAESRAGLVAYPMGKGSGSVTTFSQADGFVTIPRQREIAGAGESVSVRLLAKDLRLAHLSVIGSHCVGLDLLLSRVQRAGFSAKVINVGSTAGLAAAERGECDLAGIHLLDPQSGQYNLPFLPAGVELVAGYRRLQGVVFRPGDARFQGRAVDAAIALASADDRCVMVNRNQGSGTRILIDGLLAGARPAGYAVQAKSHNAVAAAVSQGRADWGLAIASVARMYGLGFLPYRQEHYDFAIPSDRRNRPAVEAFCRALAQARSNGEFNAMSESP